MQVLRMSRGVGGRTTQVVGRPHPLCTLGMAESHSMKSFLKKWGEISQTDEASSPLKVTVVGSGQVGMAVAVSCLIQGFTNELCLIDHDEKKVRGEVMDLLHGSLYMKGPNIYGSTDFKDSAESAICIVTAGVRQTPGETRTALISRNAREFKKFIPSLVKYSPRTVLMIVSNPVDVLTYIAWKISGLPKNRVFGSGTNLDSSRFRFLLSQKLNVAVKNVHGWIIGEHGDTSVPVWSSVNVAGVPLKSIHPEFGSSSDPENWIDIHRQVVSSAYEIISLKGYTNWAIGLCCAELANAVLRKQNSIHPVSTMVQGLFGVKEEVFASVPCVLGASGVKNVIQLKLQPEEIDKFLLSCDSLYNIQKQIELE